MKEKKQAKIIPGKNESSGKQDTEQLSSKRQRNKTGRSASEEDKHFDKDNSGSDKDLQASDLNNEQHDFLSESGENNYYILGRDNYNYIDDDRD